MSGPFNVHLHTKVHSIKRLLVTSEDQGEGAYSCVVWGAVSSNCLSTWLVAMMPVKLDNNVRTSGTSMLRNQRNLWFSDKFKIDKRTGKSLIALSPTKEHNYASVEGMQHDTVHLTICAMASLVRSQATQ